MTGALLRTERLSKDFAGFRALSDVTLEAGPGQLTGIIGPNGAGKSTLFNVIAGLFPPSDGRVLLAGVDITGRPPEEICRRGIAKTFQISKIFPRLTVLENVRLAVQGRGRVPARHAASEAAAVLERVGLRPRSLDRAEALSHGEQRVLDIAIALAGRPAVLLLDEPTAGMSPVETRQAAALIRQLAREHAVLLIEHDMDILLDVSDVVVALHQGRVLAEGSPAEIAQNADVRAVYFGTDACS